MNKTIKIGNIELLEDKIAKIYEENKYICTYTGIFQVFYSQAQKQYYGQKVIDYKGYTKKGKFYIQTAKQINYILRKKYLNRKHRIAKTILCFCYIILN